MKAMPPVIYRDRLSGRLCEEKPFAAASLSFLYGDSMISRSIGRLCRCLTASFPLFSSLTGKWYRRPSSHKLIAPFISNFDVDASEFAEPIESFDNFNAFFTRKLKAGARPLAPGDNVAVMPADGRYLFYPDVKASDEWDIKGRSFNLGALLGDASLAEHYYGGTMVIARLCPSDYHRFHFPCRCRPSPPRLINGYLHSVHPFALRQNLDILIQNKRFLTVLETENFGRILYLEIGAIGVGSVIQTYQPAVIQEKGAEKGYFEFGASCLILLFEPHALALDADLLAGGDPSIETLCLMGQSLGKTPNLCSS